MHLHVLTSLGDSSAVRSLLREAKGRDALHVPDDDGASVLMLATMSPGDPRELVDVLLDAGAPLDYARPSDGENALSRALRRGNLGVVERLITAGADPRYRRPKGYDAIVDASYGGARGQALADLIRLLLNHQVPPDGKSDYGESGLSVLSSRCEFDAVSVLLEAGGNEDELQWSPLARAVAIGAEEDVDAQLAHDGFLEVRDRWDRTPWHLALECGSRAKAERLLRAGADSKASGRHGGGGLASALRHGSSELVTWLLEIGFDPNQPDREGRTPLILAAQNNDVDSVDLLIRNGASVDTKDEYDDSPLASACSSEVAQRLLNAGADPADITDELKRTLLGLPEEETQAFTLASPKEYRADRYPRAGRRHPEEVTSRYWDLMVRSGVSGYAARAHFESAKMAGRKPNWSAQRFGQSMTPLPDGRTILVGGEHEDSYDPDFCIYNDVWLYEPGEPVRFFLYPKRVFPPTDFHTATLVGEEIVLVGGLSYPDLRRPGHTPVYILSTTSFEIRPLETKGEEPGWIHRHRAVRVGDDRIEISGGRIVRAEDDWEDNQSRYALDLSSGRWTRIRP